MSKGLSKEEFEELKGISKRSTELKLMVANDSLQLHRSTAMLDAIDQLMYKKRTEIAEKYGEDIKIDMSDGSFVE